MSFFISFENLSVDIDFVGEEGEEGEGGGKKKKKM